MTDSHPKILISCAQGVRDRLAEEDLRRLEQFAEWDWFTSEGGKIYDFNDDSKAAAELADRVSDVAGLVVCWGSPRIDGAIMDRAPGLRIIGEMEGDRFASRIDLEAAWERRIRTVDTTNASSYPVAEWAIALILISLRHGGAHFRKIVEGIEARPTYHPERRELTGKRVGLIGCGHMGRRLIALLRPYETTIWVYDPYLPGEMADAVGFLQTGLDRLLSESDVVVCLAPLTPGTRGMIGPGELDLIRPGAVFVNVSRGAVVDSQALVGRLRRGDITAGLDVFDPEPIPAGSEITTLPNVFLSPHIGSGTAETMPRFFSLMVDELDRFFHGHETKFDLTPRSLANRTAREPDG